MSRTKHRHQVSHRSHFEPIPQHEGVSTTLKIEGVWVYSGEYVQWKLQVDSFTKEVVIVGYTICSYGVGSSV